MKNLLVYLIIFSLLFTSCASARLSTDMNNVENPNAIFERIERNSIKYHKTTIRLLNLKSYNAKEVRINTENISFLDTKKNEKLEFPLSELNKIVIEKKEFSKGKEFIKWAWIGPTIGGFLALIFKGNIDKNQNSNSMNHSQNL